MQSSFRHGTGLFSNGDDEITDIAIHFLNLGVGQQGDIGMIANLHHFWCEDAGRAIQGGEGFIELSHMPTDGRFTFHQIDGETSICDFEGSLDTGDTASDDQRGWMDGYFKRG